MTFRFANAGDSEAFATWAAHNRQIAQKDIEAARRENNPTTVYLVVEGEGKVILCVPAFLTLRIACRIFNPEARADERKEAMEKMQEALVAFAANFGINQVDTLSKSGYSVATWAENHGFKAEDRELFELKGFLNVQ